MQYGHMELSTEKRLVQVNVRMTESDFKLLQRAAEKRWPDAEMSRSGVVLSLAKIAARDVPPPNKLK